MNEKTLALMVEKGYLKIALIPAAMGLPVCLLLLLTGQGDWSQGLFRGFVIGFLDNLIMLWGVKKAQPYVKEPGKGFRIQKRYRWYRIISAGTLMVLLSKQGYNVASAFIGLLLTHIFLIIYFIIIAYQLNKKGT